jgi:VanZ family protein
MGSVFFQQPAPRTQDGWRWLFFVWLPVVLAIGIICAESTATFSAQNTSGWLRPIAQHMFGVISDPTWGTFHHYLRKSGHFIGYGTVALTFLRAWLYTNAQRGPGSLLSWRMESTVLAIFSTAIVASCDEFHQTFVPGRTGTPIDVLLDTSGACTLCLLVWVICWLRPAPEEAW